MPLIHHVVTGRGRPPIVVAHGFACTLSDWDALVAHFAPRHLTVAVDLRGHGASPARRMSARLSGTSLMCPESCDEPTDERTAPQFYCQTAGALSEHPRLRQSERRSWIEELHLTGATVPIIAVTIGCHVNTVRSWLIRHGYIPIAACRGGDHGGGSPKVGFPVELAWQMFCDGASPDAVGKHFGVNRATIVRQFQAVYGVKYCGETRNAR